MQKIEYVEDQGKRAVLLDLLPSNQSGLTLVFVETKQMADMLSDFLLNNSFAATSIHGDRTRRECKMVLRRFRQGRTPILVPLPLSREDLTFRTTHMSSTMMYLATSMIMFIASAELLLTS